MFYHYRVNLSTSFFDQTCGHVTVQSLTKKDIYVGEPFDVTLLLHEVHLIEDVLKRRCFFWESWAKFREHPQTHYVNLFYRREKKKKKSSHNVGK